MTDAAGRPSRPAPVRARTSTGPGTRRSPRRPGTRTRSRPEPTCGRRSERSGQVATSLTMTGAQAKPATFTPNGDSQADSTVISYTLSLASTVTATLRDATGATLATLFVEQKKAGRQSFKFTATGVADGRYSVVLNAKAPSGREANVVVPIVVDRTLAAFAVSPAVYSPNGDKRLDELGFTFVLAAPAHVKLVAGKELVYEGDLGAGPQELRWDGRLRDGKYAAVLQATGRSARAGRPCASPPTRRSRSSALLSKAQRRFTVNEQVTVTGTVGGVRVRAVVGPGRFSLSGGRGPIAVTAWDAAGNRTHDPSAVAARPTRRARARGGRAARPGAPRARRRRPVSSRSEVAGCSARSGSCSAVWCTLIPIPRTTRPSRASARIPATFRPSISTSFGHLTVGTTAATSASAWAHARPATSESSARLLGAGRRGGARPRRGRSIPAARPSRGRADLVPRSARRWLRPRRPGRRLRAAAGSTRSARRRCRACRSGLGAAGAGSRERANRSRAVECGGCNHFAPKSRPIRQPLRAGSSLAYERLSDPILVKRAKDGDRQALEALCARHQPASRRSRGGSSATPRTRATRRRSRWRRSARESASSAASRSSRRGCTGSS